MSGFLQIMLIAFGAQLAVLPGEKVQFIIAGLSTRYNPLVVVAAAGSAFAGWTALELLFGEALRGSLQPVYLDAITAFLFLLFAVLLYRSAPTSTDGSVDDETGGENASTDESDAAAAEDGDVATTDGGYVTTDLDVSILGYQVPNYFGGFLPIFAMMAAGEFGDKTQLVTIGLAIQYGAHPAIWVGEMLAIIPVSLLNAYFFHTFAHRVNLRKAHYVSAALFAFFGLDTVLSILTGFSIWEAIVGTLATFVLSVV